VFLFVRRWSSAFEKHETPIINPDSSPQQAAANVNACESLRLSCRSVEDRTDSGHDDDSDEVFVTGRPNLEAKNKWLTKECHIH